jgi:hypothetical protein
MATNEDSIQRRQRDFQGSGDTGECIDIEHCIEQHDTAPNMG